MSLWKLILIICGVLLGIVLFCAGVIYLEKKYPGGEYDERQVFCRMKAHRLSFWVGFVYYLFAVITLLGYVDGPGKVEPFLLIFVGMILQALVLHTYSILTNAAVPLSEKPWVPILCFALTGTLQLSQFSRSFRHGVPGLTGREAADWIFLIAGIGFFYLSLLHLFCWLHNRKE